MAAPNSGKPKITDIKQILRRDGHMAPRNKPGLELNPDVVTARRAVTNEYCG